MEVAEEEFKGRGRKTWGKCVYDDDMKLLGLQPELAVFKDICEVKLMYM